MKLTKADVRRALVRHHFTFCASQMEVFDRLRSIQFDPIAPVGCNHDLVLQARLPGYRIGDWSKTAYDERRIYDGWDKQASLVPFEGWPVRRYIHQVHRRAFEEKIFEEHCLAVDAILKEIERKGPMMPKDFDFQAKKEEWKGSWFGPSVTKQTLRALWHSGLIMTSGRKGGQHIYDLTERVVPSELRNQPELGPKESQREIAMDRYRAMGLIRPASPPEIWSFQVLHYDKREIIADLASQGAIVPVDVEGVKAHATPDFLSLLDQPSLDPRVVFVAPLDPFMWDRKMVAHLFDFDYIWEIYTPLAKRKWGYYVLPILFGDRLVARAEFWGRDGVLELREWHFEDEPPPSEFWDAFEPALSQFMGYASARRISARDTVEKKVRALFTKKRKG